MSRNLIMALAAIAVWPTGVALADAPMVATLANTTESKDPILDGTIWHCADTKCVSKSNPTTTGVSACRSVASHFGQIVSFTSNGGLLDDSKLARCNSAAKSK